jgi:hypothetical protein
MLHSKTIFASNAFRVGGSDSSRDDPRAEIDGPEEKDVNTFAYLAEPRGRQLFVPRKRSSQLFGRNRSNGEQIMAPGNAALLVIEIVIH